MRASEKWSLLGIKCVSMLLCLALVLFLVQQVVPGYGSFSAEALEEEDPTLEMTSATQLSPQESIVGGGEDLLSDGTAQNIDTSQCETTTNGSAEAQAPVSIVTTSTPAQESSSDKTPPLPTPAAKQTEETAQETVSFGEEEAEPTPAVEEGIETSIPEGEFIVQADVEGTISVGVGEVFTLAVGVRFTRGDASWESLRSADEERVSILKINTVEQWTTAPEALEKVIVQLANHQGETPPFTRDSLAEQTEQTLLSDGVNHGYAVFEGLQTEEEIPVGDYRVHFVVSWWRSGQGDAPETAMVSLLLHLKAEDKSEEGEETEKEEIAEKEDEALSCCCTETQISEQAEETAIGPDYTVWTGEEITDGNTGTSYYVMHTSEETVSGAVLLVDTEAHASTSETSEEFGGMEASVCPCATGKVECAYCSALAAGEEPPEDQDCVMEYSLFSGISPMSLMVDLALSLTTDEGGIIVFTIDELRTAITAGNELIYLGYNDGTEDIYQGQTVNNGSIAASGAGCPVPSSVSSLKIIGRDPYNGKRVTFSDWTGLAQLNSIYPTAASQTITLYDMTINGINYYGTMAGNDKSNTTLIYDTISYTGPQTAYNRGTGSIVIYRDTDITLQKSSSAPAQEAAEVPNVRLEGAVNISHDDTDAVFWLTGSPNSLTVASGADVNITTTNYFIYCEATNVDVDIIGSLTLTVNGDGAESFFQSSGKYANLNIPSGGSLIYTHNRIGTSWYGSLRTNNATVDGTLIIRRSTTTTSNSTLEVASGCTLTIGPSAYVELSNSNGPVLSSASGTSTCNISTSIINRYEDASDTPTNVWNNAELSAFTISMSLKSSASNNMVNIITGLNESNKGDALGAVVLANISPVHMGNDRKLVLGSAGRVTMPKLLSGTYWFAGEGPSGAVLQATEVAMAGGVMQSTLQRSGSTICEGGTYSFETAAFDSPLQSQNSRVYVQAQSGGLVYYTYADVTPGIPEIVSIPSTLAFEIVPLSSKAQIIGRQNPNWQMEVYDPRGEDDSYRLCVSIDAPLTGQTTGDTLDGALVYVGATQLTPLSSTQLPVATKRGVEGQTTYTHQWAADMGLLVALPAFTGISGESYQTEMRWTLVIE